MLFIISNVMGTRPETPINEYSTIREPLNDELSLNLEFSGPFSIYHHYGRLFTAMLSR